MAISFPTSLDTFTNPIAGDALNAATVPHATQHANANDAVEALEKILVGKCLFNVQGYGATGDGSTDDTTAVQAAIDAAEAAAGGVVLFPGVSNAGNARAVYIVSGLSVQNSHLDFVGLGMPSIKLKATSNKAVFQVGKQDDGPASGDVITDVGFFRLEIDGNYSVQTANPDPPVFGDTGITLVGVDRATISHCYIHDTWNCAISVAYCSDVLIDGNTIEYAGMKGFVTLDGYDPRNGINVLIDSPNTGTGAWHRIVNNTVRHCTEVGINVFADDRASYAGTEGIIIAGNIVEGWAGADHAALLATAVGNLYGYMLAIECEVGYVSSTKGIIIANNILRNGWSGAIGSGGAFTMYCSGLVVDANYNADPAGWNYAYAIQVVHNTVYGFRGTAAISLLGRAINCVGNVVEDYHCETAQAYGIRVKPDAEAAFSNRDINISGNILTASPDENHDAITGIAIIGDAPTLIRDVTIQGNVIHGPNTDTASGANIGNTQAASVGIYVYGDAGSLEGIKVIGNKVQGHADGIYVGFKNVVVEHNECSHNSGTGIYCDASAYTTRSGTACDGLVIHGNVCRDNGKDTAKTYRSGIYLGGTTNSILEGNILVDTRSGGDRTQIYGIHQSGTPSGVEVLGGRIANNLTDDVNLTTGCTFDHVTGYVA